MGDSKGMNMWIPVKMKSSTKSSLQSSSYLRYCSGGDLGAVATSKKVAVFLGCINQRRAIHGAHLDGDVFLVPPHSKGPSIISVAKFGELDNAFQMSIIS